MYRHYVFKFSSSIYCPIWPCDRECGLIHLPLLKFHGEIPETDGTDSGRPSTTNLTGDFEDIMARAGQKVSISYVEPPLPPPLLLPDQGRSEERQLSPHIDTTILFFKSGVDTDRTDDTGTLYGWRCRRQKINCSGDPPSTLDTESTIGDLLTRNSHDLAMNPIFHDRIDSRIDSDEESYDYSRLDSLPPGKLEHRDSLDSMTPSINSQISKAKQWRRAHYEPSLDIV